MPTNPCHSCGSPCPEDCKCPEPLYSPLGCKEPVPFKCVQLLEKNLDGTNISYPCIPFATNESLFTLTERVAAWKCQYDNLITKVKVSQYDTSPAYISDKIILGECLTAQIINPGANEKMKISLDYQCILDKIILLPGLCSAIAACGPSDCLACTNLVIT